mgnify:CR=1 FL=1
MRTIWRWTKMSFVRMELLCHKFSMTISSQSKWQRKFAPYRKVIWHSCYFSNVITGFTFLDLYRILPKSTFFVILISAIYLLPFLSLCRKHRFQFQGKLAPLNRPHFYDGYRWTIQFSSAQFCADINIIKLFVKKCLNPQNWCFRTKLK